jgi:hypothetical protein
MKLTHFLRYTALLVGLSALASCGEMSEEIWINADGTGKQVIKFDASESLGMIAMMMEMEKANKAQEEAAGEDEADSGNPMDEMSNFFMEEKFDTSFSLFSTMPDSLREQITDRDLLRQKLLEEGRPADEATLDKYESGMEMLKDILISMRMNKEENILDFSIANPFEDISNTSKSFEALKELTQLSGNAENEQMARFNQMTRSSVSYSMSKGKLTLRQNPLPQIDDLAGAEEMETEQLEALLGQMGLSDYKVIVHVPGEVKTVSGTGFEKRNDNTVVIELDFLEAYKTGELTEAVIEFKPKRKYKTIAPAN